MGSARDLSRKSLRRDQVLEVKFAPLPDPPEEMLRLPGVRVWVQELRLMRERDNQMLLRLVNNLGISTQTDTETT